MSKFQCSSASRKFLNARGSSSGCDNSSGFSALQRAENSSMDRRRDRGEAATKFQCSSASRKFLNTRSTNCSLCSSSSFSALQRAENSSINGNELTRARLPQFQCSSASRKFLNSATTPDSPYDAANTRQVSVLFSEPKIPQSRPSHLRPSIFPTAMITLRHS